MFLRVPRASRVRQDLLRVYADGRTSVRGLEVLGHSSIAITKDVYGHLVEGQKRAAAARMSEALLTPNGSPAMAPRAHRHREQMRVDREKKALTR